MGGVCVRLPEHTGRALPAVLVALTLNAICGCAVPQKPGKGLCTREVEPETRTPYYLYLPEDYVKNKGRREDHTRWPTVVTFHGLRPYDDAEPQIREWQEEADRYGFIVIAPELRTCDSLTMQFPLRDPTLPYVQQDERAVLATMDEVFRRTNADPGRVLATSFSSGGYLAHYMVNKYPERFTTLAVRGSNFSPSMLDPARVPRYRTMKVGIFFGENDFKVCRDESMQAVDWYRRNRFQVVAKMVKGLGHERRPQVAAALFAAEIGVTPKTPPEIGAMVMDDVAPAGPVAVAPRPSTPRPVPAVADAARADRQPPEPTRDAVFSPPPDKTPARTSDRPVPLPNTPVRVAPVQTTPRPAAPASVTSPKTATPKRPVRQPYDTGNDIPAIPPVLRTAPLQEDRSPVHREVMDPTPVPAWIQVHGDTVGTAPLWVSLSVQMPQRLRDGASILWTDNHKPFASNSFEAQGILREPGNHQIEAIIITADDQKLVLRKTVFVQPPASQPAGV